jgi:hypothetical protein
MKSGFDLVVAALAQAAEAARWDYSAGGSGMAGTKPSGMIQPQP